MIGTKIRFNRDMRCLQNTCLGTTHAYRIVAERPMRATLIIERCPNINEQRDNLLYEIPMQHLCHAIIEDQSSVPVLPVGINPTLPPVPNVFQGALDAGFNTIKEQIEKDLLLIDDEGLQRAKCECGSSAVGSPAHSDWCPLYCSR